MILLELLAHLLLAGRHGRSVAVGGLHWRYCGHRSHRRGLRCWRWQVYDGHCPLHNRSCIHSCP
ncbi:hypothetical protein [Streptomyces synnematoformans]|uniref:Secreted protein n=1 Tax=Streptomyces synnematoformans TaxID=415721 RepID=A0ABN2X9K8_9ACTN